MLGPSQFDRGCRMHLAGSTIYNKSKHPFTDFQHCPFSTETFLPQLSFHRFSSTTPLTTSFALVTISNLLRRSINHLHDDPKLSTAIVLSFQHYDSTTAVGIRNWTNLEQRAKYRCPIKCVCWQQALPSGLMRR